ncbi:hypothetical protein GMRT_10107 [Giardia muris]|uniref:Uncharacterized protein n=1 Tax=Giardia muris TaxID=5742 RepID=A0A4Z1T3Y7_GIAMU|nr:hypothetical protein GMRT_10107 [Giardia muris]|eukprot:TNJ27757.1 hypothetical protein GMRT_10107 [Giardia muris]
MVTNADAYKAQVLSCMNVLLAKLNIREQVSDASQITFTIIHELALVYFKLERFPEAPHAGRAPHLYDREEALLGYVEAKLKITTGHISPKGLHENQLFDCIMLFEIIYTLIKSDDMPSYPTMPESVAIQLLKAQTEQASQNLMARQADYLAEQHAEDPRGILSAQMLLQKYGDPSTSSTLGGGSEPSLGRIEAQSGRPGTGEANMRKTGGTKGTAAQEASQRPTGARYPSLSRPTTTSSASPTRPTARKAVADPDVFNQEVRDMVNFYYERYLRPFVDDLEARKAYVEEASLPENSPRRRRSPLPSRSYTAGPRSPTRGVRSGSDTSLLKSRPIQSEEERLKIRLNKIIHRVLQEIHQQEVSYYYKLENRITQTLKKALAVERENLRLEAQWRRDILSEQARRERIVSEGIATKRANDLALLREAEAERQRYMKINKLSLESNDRSVRRAQEDQLFERIERALKREAGVRIKAAVDNFELCDNDIDRIVVERLRQYAGAERDFIMRTPSGRMAKSSY